MSGAPSFSVSGGHRWSPALTGGKGIYFLWAGINDWLIAGITDPTVIVNKLKSIYALARADGYQTIVGFTNPHDGDATHDSIRAAVNSQLIGMTLGGSNTPDVLVRLDLLFRAYNPIVFGDGLHISTYGNKLIAEYVWAKINHFAIPRLPHVSMTAYAAQDIAADTEVKTAYLGAVIDESGLFDSANQQVFCPYAGIVEIETVLFKWSAAATVIDLRVYKNGSTFVGRIVYSNSLAGFEFITSGRWPFTVSAGDVLEFRPNTQGTTNAWTFAGSDDRSARFTVSYREVFDF